MLARGKIIGGFPGEAPSQSFLLNLKPLFGYREEMFDLFSAVIDQNDG
jgi:hypothetical protein